MVCDSVRPEQHGKLTVLGFSGFTPRVTLTLANLAGAVQLAFVFALEPGTGQATFSFDLVQENGNRIVAQTPVQPLALTPAQSQFIVFQLITPFPAAGRYRVRVLEAGREHYSTTLTIAVGPVP